MNTTREQDIHAIAAGLRGTPNGLVESALSLPVKPGFYAWWGKRGCIPGVPSRPHPSFEGYDLLYVGIAPSRVKSKSTIRTRVLRNHRRGNIAASTLRLSLASLLHETLGLLPRRGSKKVLLTPPHNKVLSDWQLQNLMLTWHPSSRPWDVEALVIAKLRPPLNLDDNEAEEFLPTLKAARKAFRKAATSQNQV